VLVGARCILSVDFSEIISVLRYCRCW